MLVKRIAVIGLGKLGSCTAACFAEKGYRVIGVDVNEGTIKAINSGKAPVFEPHLDELIESNRERIFATRDYSYSVMNSDASFIIVPTPSEDSGGFSTKYVETAAREIAKEIKKKNSFHVIAVTSTVLPGDMETVVKPLIEEISGKRCGVDFGLCYNPDFIALGSIIHNLLNPDMVLIGESDPRSGDILEGIHRRVCENTPEIHRMNFHNAELTKIALNSFITGKITFANVLAEICENMPAGDVDIITEALGADTRVGRKYLKGALSYGGPCFPRDNRAFAFAARKFGCENSLALKTDQVNAYHNRRIVQKISKILQERKGNQVAILGLTYKPDTVVTQESAAVAIVRGLLKKNIFVRVFDAVATGNVKRELGKAENLYYARSIKDCLRGTSLCFIATPWKEFRGIDREIFISSMKEPVVLDAWGVLNFADDKEIEYRLVGHNY